MASDVKPIRTGDDYRTALKEMKRLWGSKAGTPEGDRLDVLATLVDVTKAGMFPSIPPIRSKRSSFAWSSKASRSAISRRCLAPACGLGKSCNASVAFRLR